jgi:pyridoxine kinase
MQDLSCMGKCSLTVALPVLSAMGIECAVLPTAVLSTHTAFPNPAVLDLGRHVDAVMDHWSTLEPHFDGISIGYLARPEQCAQAERLIRRFGGESCFVCIDPAMADHGKLYAGLTAEHPAAMKRLCAMADLIVPNVTEGALLTGMEYRDSFDAGYCREMVDELLKLGCKSVMLTGFVPQPGSIGVLGKTQGGEFFSCHRRQLPRRCHGTGDLFAAVVMGAVLNGLSPEKAGDLACGIVRSAIERTPEDSRYGVAFEGCIRELLERL